MDELVIFEFKKKVGERPCYAEIAITASKEDGASGIDLQFDCDVGEFKSAIMFGADYFYHYYFRSGHKAKIKVVIRGLRYFDIDTTHINVAYVTVQALAKALGISVEGLKVDEENPSFIFPII
jgi:hypothetical protein